MVSNIVGKVLGKAGSKVSGLQPKLIEWRDATPNDVVWRYPEEVIPWGSTVVVKEWERAIFYRDGKVYGMLSPGRHVLDTQNVPFLQGLVEGVYGESIFRSIVVFVNTNRMQGKFGGRSQTVELIPVLFHGVYYYRVADPVLFVNKVVGPDERYTREELDSYIRSYFLTKLMSFISGSSIRDLYMRVEEAGKRALMILRGAFDEIGLMLEDLQFEGIDVPPEYRERMFWLMQGTSAAYLVQQETARKFAEAIEKTQAGGAAIGAGVVAIPWALQPPPPQAQQQTGAVGGLAAAPQQQYIARCPYCGQGPVPANARFCPYCGKQVRWCPNGHVSPLEANFCPVCGSKLS
ncbi:MAG: SPFH domain-containing protein [Ignisphaera sp.]|nr:SPFH domain-containing protein [Ignisphaera sp.]MDW8085375.1 SPFH domain-containing protein [Ignisphaera sp.]